MNPSNPTAAELHDIERVFFTQMKRLSMKAAHPNMGWLHSFDFQCSDRWM